MVDVDAAEALLARLDGNPLLAGVVVHHDGGPRLTDALFTAEREKKNTTRRFRGNESTLFCSQKLLSEATLSLCIIFVLTWRA